MSDFLELSNGKTCYEVMGNSSNPVVVLVHGLSSPMCIWDKNVEELAKYFCVVRYDLYGRGYSARPDVRYDLELFLNQLDELIQTLSISKPIHLVGLSMGGAIVTGYTVRFPEKVNKIVLIAPAGIMKRAMMMKLMGTPFVGKLIYEVFGRKALIRGVLETIGDSEEDKLRMKQVYEEQMKISGYREAILSTLKYGPICDMENYYIQLGKQDREGCLIWGEKDNVVPISCSQKILEWVPWFNFYPIPDGTHAVNFQKAKEVNFILCSFLTK